MILYLVGGELSCHNTNCGKAGQCSWLVDVCEILSVGPRRGGALAGDTQIFVFSKREHRLEKRCPMAWELTAHASKMTRLPLARGGN